MNNFKLIKKINQLGKSVLTVADLEKILQVKKNSLRTVISRLTKKGVLEKIGRGCYTSFDSLVVPEEVAGQLYYPSYLSLKTVLSKVGVINQIPRQIYLVTSRKSYQTKISGVPIIFRQIKKELFFGYYLDRGIMTAYPEKALLDLLYFVSLGREMVNFKELSLSGLKKSRLNNFKNKFPKKVREIVNRLKFV